MLLNVPASEVYCATANTSKTDNGEMSAIPGKIGALTTSIFKLVLMRRERGETGLLSYPSM